MGTYLYFKLEDTSQDSITQANKFVDSLDEQAKLDGMGDEDDFVQTVYFHEEDYYPGVGAGSIKTNSISQTYHEEAMELYTRIFETLHDSSDLNVKILSNSCSISPRTFTPAQLQRLTNHGKALSGDKKDEYRKTLRKWREIDSFPSNFVSTFRQANSNFRVLDNMDGVDLTDDEMGELATLLDDYAHLRVLDLLLTFHNDAVPVDLIADKIYLSPEEVKTASSELYEKGVTKYKLTYIPDDYHLYENLIKIHDQTVEA